MSNLIKYKSYVNSSVSDWVVFLHGIGGDSRTFSLQLKAFKPHFNLLFPDLRGHGSSKNIPLDANQNYSLDLIVEDVFRVMDHLGIGKAHYIGGSFGAILIRAMESHQPQRFLSVVISGAVLRLKPSVYFIFKAGKILAPYINNHFLYTVTAYFIMPRKNHAKSRQIFIDLAKAIDPKEYTSWLVLLEEVKGKLDILFKQPFISPVLLIMGDQDHAFVKDSIRFCNINPTTKIVIIQKCGHLSNIERYCEFNQLALKFLKNSTIENISEQVFVQHPRIDFLFND